MSGLVTTFAEPLKRDALLVDVVDQDTFDRVRGHVVQYLSNELQAAYFGLMTPVGDRWAAGAADDLEQHPPRSGITVRTGESYTRQVALALDQRRPLWVVSADKADAG